MNRYLERAYAELPGYNEALAIAEQAAQMLNQLRSPEPVAAALDPLRTGNITSEWLDAIEADTATAAQLDRRRNILLTLKRDATARATSMAGQHIDSMLTRLHGNLSDLLDDAADVVEKLGGASTAEQAIAKDAGAAWKQLTSLAGEYAQLRDAQREVMTHAPADVNISARRADGTGEDHASDLWLSNLDDLWPDWRHPNHAKTVRINDHQDRLEPWPTDSTQLLLWLATSAARAWVPTLPELDELHRRRVAKANPTPTVMPGIRRPINQPSRVI